MYRIYKPWGRLIKKVDTIEEVMEWVHAEYPHVPPHYYESVTKVDKACRRGIILCWSGAKIKKGEDEMTEYTSF